MFARFQVVGELVASRDVSRTAKDGIYQGRRDNANLSQQTAGIIHLMLLKAGFSLQRGEKLREGSRYLDRKPQGGFLISEIARKDA